MNVDWRTREGMAVADQTLNHMKVPTNTTVAALVVGYDLDHCVYVHFKPLPQGRNTPCESWRDTADERHQLSVYVTPREVLLAARQRWPNVKVYDCHCTCCCDDLDEVPAA